VVLIATGLRKMPNPTAVQTLVVAHEIPFKPLTWVGILAGLHAYPALTEVKTESTPTAKQSAVLGHDTAFRSLAPDGGFCVAHNNPPVVVPMMVDPAPLLPLFPRAMQSTAFAHEMPVRSTALGGAFWSDHVAPLLEVPTRNGVELRLVPTAMQVVSFGHPIEVNREPKGMEDVVVQLSKLLVLRLVEPPPLAIPTATQCREFPHDTAVKRLTRGWLSNDQEPPF
jgi:hypothetical protein